MSKLTVEPVLALPPFLFGGGRLIVAILLGACAVHVGIEPALAQSSADDWFKSGLEKSERGDFRGAIADWSRAIELDPGSASAYADRCGAKQMIGDNDGAIADCTRAIELDPKAGLAYGGRGYARQAKG